MSYTKRILFACAIGGLIALAQGAAAPRAQCAFCRTTPCSSSMFCGGDGCVCLKEGREHRGTCVSVDSLP